MRGNPQDERSYINMKSLPLTHLFAHAAALLLASSAGAASAQGAAGSASPYLLGDADGARAQRQAKGFSHDLLWTNYYQGAVAGADPQGGKFGGRIDLYLNFDGGKLMNWPGGGLSSHIELRYGDGSGGQGGALLPTNATSVLPLGYKDKPVVTSFYATQKFSGATLLAGKINAVDLLAGNPMLGGRGIDGFMNIELAAPISGVVPPSLFGAIVAMPGHPSWTFMLFDPNDQTGKTGLERPFADGVNLGATASWPANFTSFGGSQSFGVTVSSAKGTNLADAGLAQLPPGTPAGTKRGKYVVSYQIEQLINPGWGFFGKLSKADANPNVHDYSLQFGLAGKGLFDGRATDRFGLGYYRFAFSRVLRDAFQPALPIRPESGVEAFYNYQLTPGLSVTGDLQWITPARRDRERATFAGVRVTARF